jgi:hypothetical protein
MTTVCDRYLAVLTWAVDVTLIAADALPRNLRLTMRYRCRNESGSIEYITLSCVRSPNSKTVSDRTGDDWNAANIQTVAMATPRTDIKSKGSGGWKESREGAFMPEVQSSRALKPAAFSVPKWHRKIRKHRSVFFWDRRSS